MDIFKFLNPRGDTLLEQGQIINEITDKLWVERYKLAGEFTLKGPIDSDVRALLPEGSLISHTNTSEVMIVENHEINAEKGSKPEVVITGRSFETFLEERITVPGIAMPALVGDYRLAAATTWNQAVTLIRNHISDLASDPNDRLANVAISTDVTGTGVSEERLVSRGTVYEALMNLLDINSLGIKTIRPDPLTTTTKMVIHQGVDRSATVIFSEDAGEIESADYLWSIKSLKTSIVVTGRWVEVEINGAPTGFKRRVMHVDGNFIDSSFSQAPTGADYNAVVAAMTTFGNMMLAAQTNTALSNVSAARNKSHYQYRRDYDVGDIVMVAGEYDETRRMRVTEFVEIEDKTGESSYPTLASM